MLPQRGGVWIAAKLADTGIRSPKMPEFAVKCREKATYLIWPASCQWTVRPDSPANEPTRTLTILDLSIGAQKAQGPRHPRSPASRLLRQPSYRWVTPDEVQRYQRLARRGRSVRSIARQCGRSHGTVRRWLQRDCSRAITSAFTAVL
jgi:hypothetical protein